MADPSSAPQGSEAFRQAQEQILPYISFLDSLPLQPDHRDKLFKEGVNAVAGQLLHALAPPPCQPSEVGEPLYIVPSCATGPERAGFGPRSQERKRPAPSPSTCQQGSASAQGAEKRLRFDWRKVVDATYPTRQAAVQELIWMMDEWKAQYVSKGAYVSAPHSCLV